MMYTQTRTVLLLLLSALLGACTHMPESPIPTSSPNQNTACANRCAPGDQDCAKHQALRRHVVRINRDGLIIRPDISLHGAIYEPGWLEKFVSPPTSKEAFEGQFNEMMGCAERLAERRNASTVKILIHAHGGLNLFSDTDDRVAAQSPAIQSEPDDWHYPIFISWPSNALGTYGEHLVSIRGGRKRSLSYGLASLPFVLLSDLLQIGSTVTSVGLQGSRVINEISQNFSLRRDTKDHDWLRVTADGLPTAWREAKRNYELAEQPPAIHWSNYYYPASAAFATDYVGRHSFKTLTYPLRMTVGTAYNGAIVETAWRNMKRRTKNIIYPPVRAAKPSVDVNGLSYTCRIDGQQQPCLEGGRFFDYLLEWVRKHGGSERYEITLVGHSMGTIVLNNVLREYRREWIESQALHNIVYMAAADSIRNTMDSVFPLLPGSGWTDARSTRPHFYNLTLNRLAELGETTLNSILPSGSLLVNIDDHLEHPETLLDRTMGQEVNVLSVFPMLRAALGDAAPYAQFKAFDRYPGCEPDTHGGFNLMPFWRKASWQVRKNQNTVIDGCPYNAYPKACFDTLKQWAKGQVGSSTTLPEAAEDFMKRWCT